MAHGLYAYAVDLDRLTRAIGSKNLGLLQALRARFQTTITLHARWHAAHAPGYEILSLDEALEWLIIAPPVHFDDLSATVGYGMEILCHHLGQPIHIGRAGRSALRDITLAELSGIVDAAEAQAGTGQLDGGLDLKRGLLLRPIAGIDNEADYPGTGYIKKNELARLGSELMSSRVQGVLEQQPWFPLAKQMMGAMEQEKDLVTFYY